MPSIQITVPNDEGSQKFTVGEIARMILETHESSPSVDVQKVIMEILRQADGGEPPLSFRHGIEPPDEEIVFVTAAGHPYKSAASAARAARTRADLQDIVWEIVSVDGGWVIREIFDSDNWFEYYADKETMTADEIGYTVLVSTANMTRFCRSTVYREWASPLGLGVPVMFGGEGAPAAEPRSQATDDKPIELADASTAPDTPNPEVPTEAHKAEPPPKGLTSAARSKGGKRSRRNPWLEEGIACIVDMLLADGTPPTYPAVWDWLCANALPDDPYAFEPPIFGCDFLYISGDELCFKDQNGNDKTMKRRALERYMPKLKSTSG